MNCWKDSHRPSLRRAAAALAALAAALPGVLPAAPACATAAGLKRAGFLGAAVAPSPEGARVQMVDPGTPAQQAGLRQGDVVAAANGTKITTPAQFVQTVGRGRAGDVLTIELLRGGERVTKKITLAERPREQGGGAFDVLYDAVTSKGARLRTIVTRPRAGGKRPAVFLIQGLGCFSVENPPGGAPGDYTRILYELTRSGYVTLRVDKPGCGDSEGGPCRDNDFETVLDGYRQALASLKKYDFVDGNNLFLFGHSMGGIMGPILASETPVRGIAVYGTAATTWYEYLLENARRQQELAGNNPAETDRDLRRYAAFHHHLFVEKQAPAQIAEKRPELSAFVAENVREGKYMAAGRHYRFFQQLSEVDPGALWGKVGAHVLAIWGKGDFVSSGADHARIARIVNQAHPGKGECLALDGIDHSLKRAASQEESFRRARSPQPQPPPEFNPVITDTLRTWMDKTSQRTLSRKD